MSINFTSIKVWNKLPADIPTSDSLNVFMDNFRILPFTVLSSSQMYFLFSAICCISV